MKEANLRLWHRQLGIILAIFIIVQTGSGFFLNLGQLGAPHTHEEGTPGTQVHPSAVTNAVMTIHHGGVTIGAIYRLLLGAGLIIQVLLGILIFFKIRSRSRSVSARGKLPQTGGS